MADTLSEHQAMTETMERIRSERDFLIRIIGEAAHEELLKARRTIAGLEEEVSTLESNVIQLRATGQAPDYSD